MSAQLVAAEHAAPTPRWDDAASETGAAGGRPLSGRAWVQAPLFRLLHLVAPADVAGLEHVEALAGPALLVANHASHLDTPALLAALPRARRDRVAVAAAADYFFSRPALGWFVRVACNAFPVPRSGGPRAVLAQWAALIRTGQSILVYPEGTRSATGGMGSFKRGVGYLAVELEVPVVPVCIAGLHRVLPKGSVMPRPGRTAIRFGPPIVLPPKTPYGEAAALLESAVRALAIEDQAARLEGSGDQPGTSITGGPKASR